MSEEHHEEHVTQGEFARVLQHIDVRFDQQDKLVAEQFRSQFNRTLLVIGLAVGFIKVDTIKEAGVAVVLLAVAKGASLVFFRA